METDPVIRPVQKASYSVPWKGDSWLNEEIMWYATSDDRILGVVVRDRIDDDFGWVVLVRDPDVFRGIDVQTSLPTVQAAIEELHSFMRELAS